jgi:hypothetical protein
MPADYPPAFEHYAAVPAAGGDAVLTVGRRLPCVRTGERLSLPAVIDAFEPTVGRPRYFLLAGYAERPPDGAVHLRVFDRAAASGETVALADADPDELVPAELRPALARWLAEQRGETPVPELRPAWARPGWHDVAEAWVGSPLVQLRAWPLSAVLRGERDGEPVYLKAVFPLFHHEPTITEALARESPGFVPDVLAIDRERGWLLMAELPGVPGDHPPGQSWERLLRELGRVQRAWSDRTDELLALGAQDRGLDTLVPELEQHPTLLRCLGELAALDLPATLGHGDLHLGNVTVAGDGRAIVYDWSDACVCHPLFDLAFFLSDIRDEPLRDDLVAAWAEGWEAPVEEIRAALRLADPLTCIHQRISYREIAASIEPDDHALFAGEPERWLEKALRRASA